MGAKSKSQLRKHVFNAFRNWYLPSRAGTEPFLELEIAQHYGLKRRMRLVDTRMALNQMLNAYLDQLARLQPQLSRILIRRYINQETMGEICYQLKVSQETGNRWQAKAIEYVTELIWDDELLEQSVKRRGRRSKRNSTTSSKPL